MASSTTAQQIASKVAVTNYSMTADSSSGLNSTWVDMRNFEGLLVTVMATALTGNGVTALSIQGSASSSGTNAADIVTKTMTGLTPDAVGDTIVLEMDADQMREVGAYRYASAKVTSDNAADDFAITYVRTPANRQYEDLTDDVIA